MAGVRFAPALGFRWDSVNTLIAGTDMLHEFGSNRFIGDIYPTAYYKYDKQPFLFLMGAFPRDFAVGDYPRFFSRIQ